VASAPAKVNLWLRAGPPRADGYHPLITVFQAVDLRERVTVRAGEGPGIGVSVAGVHAAAVPLGPDNLAVRAAAAVAGAIGVTDPAIHVAISKAIPVAGGLAGGSADAAATLVACNEYWQGGLERAQLHKLAAGLGSDVNFCLDGGTAAGYGRGERLDALPTGGPFHWVLVTSDDGLSTPAVFRELDRQRGARVAPLPGRPPAGLLAALERADAVALGEALANDLQAPALSLRPDLAGVLDHATQAGALGAVVTGSGPTVIALARDAAHRERLAEGLRARGYQALAVSTAR
jgi:4-diphosphocytidyl-2-C-methyl-D-erythritol kinase